jgi:hypothetical protein
MELSLMAGCWIKFCVYLIKEICSVMCHITNEISLTFILKIITGDLHEMKPSCKDGRRKIKLQIISTIDKIHYEVDGVGLFQFIWKRQHSDH